MTEIKLNPSLDPDRMIHPEVLPRLAEFAEELPGLFGTAGVREWMGYPGDPETEASNLPGWMSQLAKVARAYEAANQLVQSQDELFGQTMASFGRF